MVWWKKTRVPISHLEARVAALERQRRMDRTIEREGNAYLVAYAQISMPTFDNNPRLSVYDYDNDRYLNVVVKDVEYVLNVLNNSKKGKK